MSVSVGDKVQIKNGGIDVTNGLSAKAGKMYGEGGPLWAVVVKIVDNWAVSAAAQKKGVAATVTKVRCAGTDGSTIVWQVRPEDIAGQVVTPEPTPPPDPPPPPEPEPPAARDALAAPIDVERVIPTQDISGTNSPYAPQRDSNVWTSGGASSGDSGGDGSLPDSIGTATISDSMFADDAGNPTPSYKLQNISASGIGKAKPVRGVYKATYKNSWQNSGRKKEMLNQDPTLIQNEYGYPYHIGTGGDMMADLYDYQFKPGDSRYSGPAANLEDKLQAARAALGIHVHGSNDIARYVKFYMYNRFKVPDHNLAHNRSTTHVFFTRPDLNLLTGSGSSTVANQQALNHTEAAMLWRRQPEIFKMLTDYRRINDGHNLNLLLSQQVTSFNLQDESISTIRAGRSWNEHEMVYGDSYTGRTAGEFSCSFDETSEYTVINMLKLWITYIDNVSRGAWAPNYSGARQFKHVYDRALDYAASAYVFKCGPDGEDVLYWSKYYGVFPIVTGSSALNWELGSPIGTTPKLNITFAYSFKRDLSPISLLEFNDAANVSGGVNWVPSFMYTLDGHNIAHCARPFVGPPYIEIDLGVPVMDPMDVSRMNKHTQIRLKFREDTKMSDRELYRANLAN